jgi:choline kinase
MKAIILAAGSGRRLRIHKPKGMLNIGGKPLIDYSINNLKRAGIEDILVVTGFKSELYENHFMFNENVNLIHNPEYANSGSLYSLYLALKHIGHTDVVVLDSDIIYNWDEFSQFIHAENKNAVFTTNVPDNRHDACYIESDLSDCLVKISKNINTIRQTDDQPWEHIGIVKSSMQSIDELLKYAEDLFAKTGTIDHEYDYAFESIPTQYHIERYVDYVWSEVDDNEQLAYLSSVIYPKITLA